MPLRSEAQKASIPQLATFIFSVTNAFAGVFVSYDECRFSSIGICVCSLGPQIFPTGLVLPV